MALKIIDLDIDEALSAVTRVEEVGFVLQPAIETEMIFFTGQQFEDSVSDYPQYIIEVAQRAKKWVEENGYGSCMTPVGKARLNQLANAEPLSILTLKRMKAYGSRHKQDWDSSKSFEDGCGYLALASWGFSPENYESVMNWLEREITKSEEMDYAPSLPPYVGYATGDSKDNMLIVQQGFIEKIPYERKDDYIQRCVAWHIKNKGWDSDQAYAVCINQAEEAFVRGEKVSFDWDETLNTWRGEGLALHERNAGSELYIISARQNVIPAMLKMAEKLGIPESHVYATGSNLKKIEKIKQLRINRHYDNNEEVISNLGNIGVEFNCSCLDEYVQMATVSEQYNLVGFVDGEPIFSTPVEAEVYGNQTHGCSGHHVHIDEDGNEVYMACEMHPQEYGFGVDEYDEDEIEVIKLLKFLADTDYQQFEAVIGSMRGATESEIMRRGHRKPVFYFKYDRVLSGSPDRDFCTSIENRFFRRFEIDLLQDTNREFGHKQQPYSKWLYKGGPNCVHAWRRFIYTPKEKNRDAQLKDIGMVSGKPGIPPKSMENNGYYSAETKRKSEVAYIISQQNMSKQQFKSDDEKRMVYTPLMLPNILIPRVENGEKYYVRFKPEVIEKIQQKFMIEKRLNATNYEHSNHKFTDLVMVESWIVKGDKDKAYELGFTKEQVPVGSWMGGYKVLDTDEGDIIWNDYIKTGKVKGASVEGEFLLKFSTQEFSRYDIVLDRVINILKQIEE